MIPVINHNAAGEQKNIHSLSKSMPLADLNVIYSETNKAKESPTLTGKAVKDAYAIYLETIEVKHGTGSGGYATQDPSAAYAEPIKFK